MMHCYCEQSRTSAQKKAWFIVSNSMLSEIQIKTQRIKAPAKWLQYFNTTYCNIVGHNTLHTRGYPVMMCCNLLGVAGSSLKMVNFFIQHLWMLHIVLVWPGSCNNVATRRTRHNRVAKRAHHVTIVWPGISNTGQTILSWGFIDRNLLWHCEWWFVFNYTILLLYYISEKNRDNKFQIIWSTSVLLLRYVCSYSKTNGLFQHQIRTAEWFDIIFCFPIIFLPFFPLSFTLWNFCKRNISFHEGKLFFPESTFCALSNKIW